MLTILNAPRQRRFVLDAFGADGALPAPWQVTNSVWAITSGKAVATPTLGAELIVNGGFDANTNWTKGSGWTIGSGVAAHAAGSASNLTQAVLTANNWYRAAWDIATTDGGQMYAIFGGQGGVRVQTTTGSKVDTNLCITSTTAGLRAQTASLVGTVDNVSYKKLTLSDMFATRPDLPINAEIAVMPTIVSGFQAGAVGWLDDYTAPANFIFASFNVGTTANPLRLVKCVAGVYTDLIAAAPSYVAGAALRIRGRKSGANLLVSMFYNNAQIGTEQTVSDAGIVSNTNHGMFSTSVENTIDSFRVTYL